MFYLIINISKKSISEKLNLYSIRKEITFYNKIDFTSFQYGIFSYVENPKISIIITLYNQRGYILKIYSCILNQSIKEIEIIFIDDSSTDNSFLDVEDLMEKDRRIVYLKNENNRGQFYSRNKGVFHSRGEYVMIIDPDDLLLNNILIKCYNMAIKYNLDIVQFYHLMGDFKKNKPYILNKKSKICFQPETNNLFFDCETRYLWDKLIRRSIFVKSIYFMKKKFRKERFIIHNDETACFGIFKSAYSYGQLEEVGYFYNRENANSTTKNNFLPENINGRFHTLFTIMDYYYEQSEDNIYEKTKGGYRFFEYRIVRRYESKICFLTKGFKYINSILKKYINSPFFNLAQRESLRSFKDKITIQKLYQKKLQLNQSSYKNNF